MFFYMIAFAILMMIKGGSHWRIPKLKSLDHGVMGFFIDGSRLSSLLAALLIGWVHDIEDGLWFGLAWFLGNAPSMGEEAGAIGRLKHHWGPYIEKFGMSKGIRMGWTKGLQRGMWIGGMLALATGNTDFIWTAPLFPICYLIGQVIYFRIHKTDSWAYAEPIYGAVIGVAVTNWLGA